MSSVRVLVHGTGSIGMRHLRVLRERLGVETAALPVRAERVGDPALAPFHPVRNLGEARALGVTCAVIATDTGRHLADTEAALRAGLPVLLEKPVAPSIDGVAAIARLAEERGLMVRVGQNMRFLASLRAFRAALPAAGSLHAVRIECQSYLPSWRPDRDYRASYSARATDGGVLRDLVHEIDYACWLFGRPERVQARLGTGRLGIESEEEAELSWQAGSAMVSLRLDYLSKVARRRVRATGEGGEVEWDGLAHEVIVRTADGKSTRTAHPMERDDMMADQARTFLVALRGGPSCDLATLDEGTFAVAICDAARLSATQGGVVIPDWRQSAS